VNLLTITREEMIGKIDHLYNNLLLS
jgi:hypothetical protein